MSEGVRTTEARGQGTPADPRTLLCDTPLAPVIFRAAQKSATEVGSHSQRHAYASWAIRSVMWVANALERCCSFARFLPLKHRRKWINKASHSQHCLHSNDEAPQLCSHSFVVR